MGSISRVAVDARNKCAAFQDEKVGSVKVRRVRVEEIWSFTCRAEERRHPEAETSDLRRYLDWTAIEADSKLLIP